MQPDLLIVHTYNDIVVHQYRADGYLETQPILNKAGKKLQEYSQNKEVVLPFLFRLADEIQINVENIIQLREGSVSGYYIHPRAALHLAQWCDNTELTVVVSSWVINWLTSSNLVDPPKVTPHIAITPKELRNYTTLTKDLAVTISCITNSATDAKTFEKGRFRRATIAILTNLLDISSELTSALFTYTAKTYSTSESTVDSNTPTEIHKVVPTIIPEVVPTTVTTERKDQVSKVDTITCNITSHPLLWKENTNTQTADAKPLTAKPGVISVGHRKTKSKSTIKNSNEPVSVTDRAYTLYEQGIVSRLMTPMEIRNVSKRAACNYRETLQKEPQRIRSKNTNGYTPEELKEYLDPFILEVVGAVVK